MAQSRRRFEVWVSEYQGIKSGPGGLTRGPLRFNAAFDSFARGWSEVGWYKRQGYEAWCIDNQGDEYEAFMSTVDM